MSDSDWSNESEHKEEVEKSLFGGWESEIIVAIFEVGLQHASPKALMSLLYGNPSLTTEHIKSHLQKFRKHYAKEQILAYFEDFMMDGLCNFIANDKNAEPGTLPNETSSPEDALSLASRKKGQRKRKYDWEAAVEEITLECGAVMEKLDVIIQKQEKALELTGG